MYIFIENIHIILYILFKTDIIYILLFMYVYFM